ncbi:MAG: SMC-Scp complex subunit ScpB [Patescibacteria group bacterium]
MEHTQDENCASLEALLFIHGEPLSLKKIQAIIGFSSLEETSAAVSELKNRLASAERGLTLVQDDEKIQLVTKPAFGPMIKGFIKEELSEDLTPASIETLSVISYFGPISRSRIEYLRGVNSTFILRSLLMRGLIERIPDPKNQNAFLYQPSFDMLRHVGLEKKDALPDYAKFQDLLKKFEAGDSQNESAQVAIPQLQPTENQSDSLNPKP